MNEWMHTQSTPKAESGQAGPQLSKDRDQGSLRVQKYLEQQASTRGLARMTLDDVAEGVLTREASKRALERR